MSEPLPRLPPEMVDYIIDFLHDDRKTLKKCCLLSRSWVPRTRGHLFNEVKLDKPSSLKAWVKSFPNPANSPAHHARSLVLTGYCVQIEGTEKSDWIQSFTKVTQFRVYGMKNAKLDGFHNFSPTVKSLHVTSFDSAPLSSNILALVCSFPLLEDLTVSNVGTINGIDQNGAAFRPLTLPKFTGTLTLEGHLEVITTRMLDLPGDLHFKEIVWKVHHIETEGYECWWMAALMKRCFHTLEYIDIDFHLSREPHLFRSSVTGSVSDPDFF